MPSCPHANLMDPDFADHGLSLDQIKVIRDAGPAVKIEDPVSGVPFWAVTHQTAVDYVSKNNELFSSRARGAPPMEVDQGQVDDIYSKMFLNMDPPQSLEYRKLIRDNFSPAVVATYEPRLTHHAREIIDKVIDSGECEFVVDVAAELPLITILEMFDIPVEDRGDIFKWTNTMFFADDPEEHTSPDEGMEAAMQLMVYIHGLAEKYRDSTEKNIITQLLHGQVDGQPITDEEFCWTVLMAIVAGNESTRTGIAQGMKNLMNHPEQYRYLQNNMDKLPAAIDEMLRYNCSFICMRRTATADVTAEELGNVAIKKGDKVVLYYHGANYDESVFGEDSYLFNIHRAEKNPSLARDMRSFGQGRHSCLGMHLAKLEMRLMFEQLLTRMDNPQFSGPVRYMKSNFVQGIKAMPITFEKRGH